MSRIPELFIDNDNVTNEKDRSLFIESSGGVGKLIVMYGQIIFNISFDTQSLYRVRDLQEAHSEPGWK